MNSFSLFPFSEAAELFHIIKRVLTYAAWEKGDLHPMQSDDPGNNYINWESQNSDLFPPARPRAQVLSCLGLLPPCFWSAAHPSYLAVLRIPPSLPLSEFLAHIRRERATESALSAISAQQVPQCQQLVLLS